MRVLLVLFLLLTTACITACVGGPEAETPALITPRLGPESIEGAGGTVLALSQWRARGAPRAVILALHGYGDYAPSTFGAAAEAWQAAGITTYAYDQRGFGRNDSWGDWPGPDVLVADLRSIAATLRRRHPDLPLTVVGHSMGGGVALAAAAEGLAADRLVLAAPAIAGGDQVNPFLRLGGWAMGLFFADRRFTGEGVVVIWPTDNIDALRRLSRDRLGIGNPSGRELSGLLRIMDRAARGAGRVTMPTLTLMGAQDQVIAPTRVREVAARIPGGVGYVLYPDGWHWLFRDRQAARVWRDVAAFALREDVP